MTLRDELKGILSKDEMEKVPSSFDILGNKVKSVAIIEIPDELKYRKQEIAEALMRKHKNVKSVLMKCSQRKGVFRNRDFELIGGSEDTEVLHVESGCRILVDPQKAYFSQRESTERLRIAEKVKKGETVMVFFSGVGPFQVVIAKRSKAKRVIGIEINDRAVLYSRENASLNKVENMVTIFGDARNEAQRYYGKCDRVVMPLPETGIEYMEEAARCLRNRGTIHFYCFVQDQHLEDLKEEVLKKIRSLGFYPQITETRKVLPYGPRIWKVRIDIEVKKHSAVSVKG